MIFDFCFALEFDWKNKQNERQKKYLHNLQFEFFKRYQKIFQLKFYHKKIITKKFIEIFTSKKKITKKIIKNFLNRNVREIWSIHKIKRYLIQCKKILPNINFVAKFVIQNLKLIKKNHEFLLYFIHWKP